MIETTDKYFNKILSQNFNTYLVSISKLLSFKYNSAILFFIIKYTPKKKIQLNISVELSTFIITEPLSILIK